MVLAGRRVVALRPIGLGLVGSASVPWQWRLVRSIAVVWPRVFWGSCRVSFLSGDKSPIYRCHKTRAYSAELLKPRGIGCVGKPVCCSYVMGKVHVGYGTCGYVISLLNLPISEVHIQEFIERNIFKCYGQNHVTCEKCELEHMNRSVN